MSCRNDENLTRLAIEQFINRPHSYGTDHTHGGLFYFLDREGHSPVQLEWNMKLWWVHCEAMLAFLMAYQATRERRHWDAFTHMCQLCFTKVREGGLYSHVLILALRVGREGSRHWNAFTHMTWCGMLALTYACCAFVGRETRANC